MEASSSSSPSWDIGKIFVGGIAWETESATLFEHFQKYGQVEKAIVIRDWFSRNPRGFGFVSFTDPDSAERALADRDPQVILGRKVDVKRAKSRQQDQWQYEYDRALNTSEANNNGSYQNHVKSRKIFVGGLSSDATVDDLRGYFDQYGKITDAVVIYDKETRRSRGFGFVEFELEGSVEEILKKSFYELKNKQVEVKIALPKDVHNYCNYRNNYGRSYNLRMNGGGTSDFCDTYQIGTYPTYGPAYGSYYPQPTVPSYNYGASGYVGGYTIGDYSRIGYWPPYASPQNLMPFGQSFVYPGYLNGYSIGGITDYSGYHGTVAGNEKWSQPSLEKSVDTITSQIENFKV